MKKKLIILFTLINTLIFSQLNPNGWDTAWVNSYGGSSTDIGRDIKETGDKGFIITGITSSFGNGNTSIYLIKTDSLGHHEWSKTIGSANNDISCSIEISNDANYFVSGFSNWNIQKGYDGYLAKVDNLGNIIWTKSYGGNDWDFIYNSCIMPDGGLMLCGETYSDSNGGSDCYLIRTDSNGDTLWTKKIGTVNDDAFYSVEQKNNRIYVVGKTYNTATNKSDASIYKLDFLGNILQQNLLGNTLEDNIFYDITLTSNCDILLCGHRYTNTSENYILRKIDTTSLALINQITDGQNIHFVCVLDGNNNDIYALSTSIGGLGGLSAEYFRYNSGFNFAAHANFGGIGDDGANKIIRTTKGYAIIGWTKSYGNQNSSVDENVYLIVFNKANLVNDYFLLINEFQDNLSPVNIHENSNSIHKTIVYPNPFYSLFVIKFDDTSFENKTVSYHLFDNSGKLVDEKSLTVFDNRIIVDRNNLSPGIYTYRIKLNSNIISTGKISAE